MIQTKTSGKFLVPKKSFCDFSGKQNLGKLDRIFRFALAFWWLGPWAPQYSMAWLNWAVFVVGWIALAESFLGWCLVHQVLKINNKSQ